MGLVLKKKQTTALPAVSAIAAEIDAYGDAVAKVKPIQDKIKELTAALKPFKEAEAEFYAAIDKLQLNDEVDGHMERGERFQVEIGKRGSKREIKDIIKARKLLGDDLFFKLAKLTLKDIDDYLSPPERDQVLLTKRTEHSAKVTARPA